MYVGRYRCDLCGAEFDDPDVVELLEDMNGERAWYVWRVQICPNCGSEEIYEREEDEDDA